MVKGQMKIQQMAFMIVAVFFFFILVGLFFISIQLKDIKKKALVLNREQAINSLRVISDMSELNCNSRETLCIDRDKLRIMSGSKGKEYKEVWPVESIKVYQIYPSFVSPIKCPANPCNFYEIYNSGEKNIEEVSTYVSLCEKKADNSYIYENCEIAKLLVGIKNEK